MVHKPIAIMILPVFLAAVLIMGILATTSSHSQVFADKSSSPPTEESSNAGNAAQESNSGNTEEQPGLCLNEHTKTWQTCGLENSPQKHESSKTPSPQESSNNGKVAQESSNTGNAAQGANNTRQSSVPVRTPPITLTPIQAHITTKAHMTTTNEQLSKNGALTELTNVYPCRLELGKVYRFEGGKILGLPASCGGKFSENPAADCHQTSGGSWICVPKPTVERAPHTGNLYEMREAAEKKAATERKIAELGPGWVEVPAGEKCSDLKGVSWTGKSTLINSRSFCQIKTETGPALNSLAKVHNTQVQH
jgi:hypothetical protein